MKVIVKNARLSFNDLFEPKGFKDSEPAFGATLICSDDTTLAIDSEEIDEKTGKPKKKLLKHAMLLKIVEKVLQEKAGGKLPPKFKNWCYNKADGSTTREEYIDTKTGDYWAGFDAETWYVSAKKKPEKCEGGKLKVLDQEKNPIQPNSGKIFSGCYVNCIIQVYAMKDEKAGWTVQASLEAVQLLKKGERLGFKPIDAENEFDEEEVEASDIDDSSSQVDDML